MHNGKTLINEIEKEYMEKIKSTRPFKVPNYRSGDVVDVTIFKSLSEGKFNKHRGIIYSMKNRNSLDKTFKIHFNEADQNVSMSVKEFSPMVAKIDIHKYGSNQLRAKMNHIPSLDLSKTRITEPIIKGRGYKPREKKMEAAKEVSAEREKGKIKRDSTKLDASYEE
jgi:ribosomal protein L19